MLASGEGTNLQALLEAQRKQVFTGEIILVLSDHKEAKALDRARRWGLSAIYLDPRAYRGRKDYDSDILAILHKNKIDLIVLAGFMRLLSPVILEAYPGKILNIHPSLLPAFPGKQGIKDALDYGVKITGVTVHFVDQGLDTGPIILQDAVPICDNDDFESLRVRIQAVEHRLYSEAVRLVCEEKVTLRGRRCLIEL